MCGIGIIDCVDLEKSCYEMDSLRKGQVDWFTNLVLKEEKIDSLKHIFRLKDLKRLLIVEETLFKHIINLNMTGIYFEPVEEHGALFR